LGNSNFVMMSQLKEGLAHPILGLDVELDITKVFTVASVDTGDPGCSLQLNGYSPQGFNSAWQQYAIYLDNKSSIGKSKTGLLAQMPTLIRRALSEQGGACCLRCKRIIGRNSIAHSFVGFDGTGTGQNSNITYGQVSATLRAQLRVCWTKCRSRDVC
jgi:hypothetical protein